MSRRWDLVLRVVSGATGVGATQVLRGPRVVVGSAPGSGGLRVPVGRGVAAQHCTITAAGRHAAYVRPLGDNPIRLAAHADVAWDELEPVRGRARLAPGQAVHLGLTSGRGVTLQLVACRDLGVVDADRLASDAGDPALAWAPEALHVAGRRPDAWLRACVVTLLGATALLLGVAAVLRGAAGNTTPPPPDLGWRDVRLVTWDPAVLRHDGFDAPLHDFLVDEDRRYARADLPELSRSRPEQWDTRFFSHVVEMTTAWARERRHLFRRFEEVRGSYAHVVGALRQAGLPEVFAGIPMYESGYGATATSPVCARGWWQFMPEFGARYRDLEGFGADYDVRGCAWVGGAREPWTPVDKAPPGFVRDVAVYYDPTYDRCQLRRCAVDFRVDLERSTEVAIHALREVLEDPDIAASGAAVQIAIASHHAGYDDARWLGGQASGKAWNVGRAYPRWLDDRGGTVPSAHFYGDVMRCGSVAAGADPCTRYMSAWTQVYAPGVVAQFLLAVCYFAKNHPDDPVFAPWVPYLRDGAYCAALDVPSRAELEEPASRTVASGWSRR